MMSDKSRCLKHEEYVPSILTFSESINLELKVLNANCRCVGKSKLSPLKLLKISLQLDAQVVIDEI